MKILMLTPYLPYPDSSGGQIRTQNLLKHLRKWHDITLFSLIKSPQEEKYIPILEKNFCKKVRVFRRSLKPWTIKNILKTGFSALPFLVVRNFSPEAKKAIEAELKTGDYDLIHVETFYAMPHIPKTQLPIVLVDQTIEYQVYDHYNHETAPKMLRPLFAVDVQKLKYWETYYWRQAAKVIAVSKEDRQKMLDIQPDIDVDVVPNGVNLDLFKRKETWQTDDPVILFISNFYWLQNTEAAELLIKEVMPHVWKKLPHAKVWIVGQHMPDSLLLAQEDRVIVKEVAEDDVASIVDAYNQADVFVSPLRGPGGTRLKNLAAMASQLPIVSTSVGISGLGVHDKQHVLINDDWPSMAKSIIKVVTDPKLAQKLALNSRRYVEEQYDYAVIAKKLSQIYQDVAKAKHKKAKE